MTVREILKMGDPRLLRKAQRVTEFGSPSLHVLIQDLRDTMVAANGAGLAAPQIGVDLQVVIFGSGKVIERYPEAEPVPFTTLINPIITPLDDIQVEDWEGCLSVPGLRGVVPRWMNVRYTGSDLEGNLIDRSVSAFHARVVQHECDHLNGFLFPMRVRDFSRFGYTSVLFPSLHNIEDD